MARTASPYLRTGLVWLAMIAIWLALGVVPFSLAALMVQWLGGAKRPAVS